MAPGPPRTVHVSTARTWRGGEQQVAYLCGALAAGGAPPVIVCPVGSELARHAAGRGLAHVAVRRRAAVDPLFARALARACREAGAELVHAHDPHAHTAAVLARAWFGAAAPIVVHRRVDFPLRGGRFTRWKYDHPAVRRVVCVSEAIAAVLRPAIADPARLVVVHDAVDLARFPPGAADGRLRRELGFPAGVPLVLNVAALAAHKDHLTFVDAAARLLASGVEARFAIVGEGEERRRIEARVAARGLGGKVRLTGFRSDVPALLAEADLLLFTSREEGLGSTVLDAFASRLPVVATRAGGIPELVRDGDTGLLAPVGDAEALAAAAARMLRDGALRARVVEAGRRVAEDHAVGRHAARMLEVYREVLEERYDPGRRRGAGGGAP
jgi:glycosyltransferase involved in cell wall biosynthesis